MSKLVLINGSCADQTVDAVVNAANDGLWAGSGICGVIFKKAGMTALTAACKKYKTPLKDGTAVITPAFQMRNANSIIHAVGPDFRRTPSAFKELYDAYYNSLKELEYSKCVEFSRTCALNQQRIEFGQGDTTPRATDEISRDNLIGKMAEVAFARMLHDVYRIDIALDFNYYPRGKWDDQDAVINGWRIDVKATRKGGRWMLIEWSKLDFRQQQDKLSHLYAMAIVDWDRSRDLPSRRVEVVGCASVMKLRAGVPTTHILRKGEFIPGTNTRLQADNFAISFSDLEKDWESVIHYITTHSPPNLSNYPSPYGDRMALGKQAESRVNYQNENVVITEPNNGAENFNILTGLKKWLRKISKWIFR